MAKANEIKRGTAVSYNGKLLMVKDIDVQTPSARGASTLYKMRFTDVRTGQKVEERFKGDDIIETITLTRRAVQLSYVDGDEYVFMDDEDFTPYPMKKIRSKKNCCLFPRKVCGYAGTDNGWPGAGAGVTADCRYGNR